MTTVNEALNQAWSFHQQGNYRVAEDIYRQVIQQVPRSAAAWCYLGILLHDQRKFTESEDAYRQAISLQSHFPIAWNNLGNTLRMLGRIDEANGAFETALQQDPSYLSPLKNRGTLWVWTGEFDRAVAAFEQGLKLAPDEAELHRNLGVINLLQGNYEVGWREYRWRWRMPGFVRPATAQPVWQGEDLQNRTILLYPEQGLGDTIHFIRMAALLQQRGARTIVQVPQKLVPLLSSCPGIDHLVPNGAPIPAFDFHCSLVDVADRLQISAEAIPQQAAYLSVPQNLRDSWREWLDGLGTGRKIGICWQGNPDHQADVFRSIPLEMFSPLAELEGVQLVCLQHGYGIEQLDHCNFTDRVARLPENVDQSSGAFMDTAAIVQGLDLVITSDTSLAHLAGALGANVSVALPHVPDWRWLQEGSQTDWYPSMRLFRQRKMHDWKSVFQEISESL